MRLFLISLLCFFYSAMPVQKADLVFFRGNIITLEKEGERAEAIAILDGTIIGVGTNEEIQSYIGPKTRIFDLKGKTMVPGFNDVHMHPNPIYSFESVYSVLELDTVSSMKNLIQLLKKKAAIMPKGMLIRGVGYNETKLGGQPTRDFLDKASTEHPIQISHVSGHLSAANSYLMDRAGINEKTIDPAGGAFERYPGSQKPDGICKESAAGYLRRAKDIQYPPKPSHEEEMEGYRIFFRQVLAGGITSIGDAGISPEKVKIYQELSQEKFPLRFNLMISSSYVDQIVNGSIPKLETDYLRVATVKCFHGNSLSGKTCWLYEPYDMVNPKTGKKDYYGIPPARSQGSLDTLFQKIQKAGWQIAVHSNGDREIDMVIKAMEYAQKESPKEDPRNRIEHCSITNQDILNHIKADKIIPVFHNYQYELGEKLLVYGPKRLEMIHPTKTALDMGIVFALHSDAPISPFPAMLRLCSTVNRKTKEGVVISPNQRITAEQAIKAFTYGGAYTSFEETKKGRIKPGMWADLVILDADPTKVDPDKIRNIQVLTTLVGGQMAYKNENN